ncbi:MAG: porin [Collimonas pratensis]|uniref:porin n=1 Tax=Collimonas pratensis TaxID=279113 RepID=UPI003C769316
MSVFICNRKPNAKYKLSLLVAILLAPGINASAQTNITLYGRVDTGVRYSTHQDIAGDNLAEITSGAASGSRWGLRGSEDLGDGMKAIFMLESGFEPDTGKLGQGGRLFGRQSWMGLSGKFGALTLGRQYSPAYNVEFANEPFGWANLYEPAFIYDNYTGGNRWDNSVMYAGKFGNVSTVLMAGLGEQAGNQRSNRNLGGSFGYAAGPLTVSAGYQEARDSTGMRAHKVWTAGGTYVLKPFKFFLSYLNHRSDTSVQKNDVLATGLSYAIAPQLDLIAAYYLDHQRDLDGKKSTFAGMLNYKLSVSTNVYVEADYSRINAGYASNVFDQYAFPSTKDAAGNVTSFVNNRSSVIVGVRHQF